jgi:hypothetical protein
VSWSIGISAPIGPAAVTTVVGEGGGYYRHCRPAPVYVPAPVAYVAPPPVYVAPPEPVYVPAPVYVPQRVVYVPAPVYVEPGWHHHHHHHDWDHDGR